MFGLFGSWFLINLFWIKTDIVLFTYVSGIRKFVLVSYNRKPQKFCIYLFLDELDCKHFVNMAQIKYSS